MTEPAIRMRDQLRAARAQTADLSAAHQRLHQEFTRLRRAVRARVLHAIDDGTLDNLQDQVDQAFRDWGMPGLPTIYAVTIHAPFATTIDSSDAEQATDRARHRFWQTTAHLDGWQVRADHFELDQPVRTQPLRGRSASYRVTGRMRLTVTLRADDPQAAAGQALPIARDAVKTLPGLNVDTQSFTTVRASKAGFDPDLNPNQD
jgi:hypothetical protein